mgnify:FL=1
MWNHVKTVQTEDEGLEVAQLMGDSKAILLRGHGATTAGSSLEDAVMTMMQLEEQAKMNYWAFSAMGADHPYLEDEIVDEMSGRTPLPELPHFKQVLPPGWRPNVGGVWQYYTRIVTENPDAAPTIHRP